MNRSVSQQGSPFGRRVWPSPSCPVVLGPAALPALCAPVPSPLQGPTSLRWLQESKIKPAELLEGLWRAAEHIHGFPGWSASGFLQGFRDGKWDPTPGGAGGTEVHPLCPYSPGAPSWSQERSHFQSQEHWLWWHLALLSPRPTLTLQVKRWRCRNLCGIPSRGGTPFSATLWGLLHAPGARFGAEKTQLHCSAASTSIF